MAHSLSGESACPGDRHAFPTTPAPERREVASARTRGPRRSPAPPSTATATPAAPTSFAAAFDADPAATASSRCTAAGCSLAERVDGSAPDRSSPAASAASSPPPTLRCLPRPHACRDGRSPAGTPIEVRVFDDEAAARIEPEAARWVGLRAAAPVLGDRDAGLFTEALALANWHDPPPYCPRCGAPTDGRAGRLGAALRPSTATSHFPRTDPAVIVLVTDDDDRVLLGSNALWEQHRFSLLAGFVEPGESLEAAVVREVVEEAGAARRPRRVPRVAAVAVPGVPHAAAFTARVAPTALPRVGRARRRGDPRAALVLPRAELAAAARRGRAAGRARRSRAGCSSGGTAARSRRRMPWSTS